MQKGKIIYLNGVSGAGKTTLAKVLQEKLDEPYFMLNWDFFSKCISPKKYWDESESEGGNKDWGTEVIMLMHKTAKVYADIGVNTIIDMIIVRHLDETSELYCDYFGGIVGLLHEYPLCFVHVFCPFDELCRRKTERGDKYVDKWLPLQIEYFYPKEPYDITVNTFENTTEECADKIITLMNKPEGFTAFKSMNRKQTDMI